MVTLLNMTEQVVLHVYRVQKELPGILTLFFKGVHNLIEDPWTSLWYLLPPATPSKFMAIIQQVVGHCPARLPDFAQRSGRHFLSR